MKEIFTDIDFADSTYLSCETDEKNNLTIHLKSWNEKKITIFFKHAIQFIFKINSEPMGVFEKSINDPVLNNALNLYYEKIPSDHPFKLFAIVDIDDCCFFEVVAEDAVATKYNNET